MQNRAEEDLGFIPKPVSHRVSATYVGKDANDLIRDVWFTLKGQSTRVTTIAEGQQFEVHASVKVTKSYLQARTPNYNDLDPTWKVILAAASGAMASWAVLSAFLPTTSVLESTDLKLPDNNFAGYTNNFIMGTSDMVVTLYLAGNLDNGATVPTPSEFAQMVVV